MSRVTLHRIERGEASVTMGAYANLMQALGLEFSAAPAGSATAQDRASNTAVPSSIKVADYPQLARLAWNLKNTTELTPIEALGLYERNWRHLDEQAMAPRERALLNGLVATLGKGRALV